MESSKDRLTRSVQLILALLPMITASLYVIGRCVNSGYVEGFGIDASLFPLTFDNTIFHGFVVFLEIVVQPSIDILSVLIAVLFGGIFYSMLVGVFPKVVAPLNNRLDKFLLKLKITEGVQLPKSIERIFKALSEFIHTFSLALLAVAAVAIAGAYAESIGQQWAAEFKKKVVAGKGKNLVEITLKPNKVSLIGNSITCGTLHCAYLVQGRAVIIAHNDVDRVSVLHELNRPK